MDQTADQIEAHIDQTRERLGANIKELQQRVDTATDWREQFRIRPYILLGVACTGGILLATVLGRRRSSRQRIVAPRDPFASSPGRSGVNVKSQALDAWDNIKVALMGVATTRVQDYISELIPGFRDHLDRAPRMTPTIDPGR